MRRREANQTQNKSKIVCSETKIKMQRSKSVSVFLTHLSSCAVVCLSFDGSEFV